MGIVRGLAWTSVGGDTLQIEVNIMPGKGEFQLTGQLGDVMKESAQAGISYIRSVSQEYQIDKESCALNYEPPLPGYMHESISPARDR